jgi:hypothetical protein
MKIFKKISLVVFISLFPNMISAQCAMCRAVLESEADGSSAAAINDGIMYLMIWPYLLVGVVGFVVYRMMKKPLGSS